MKISTQEILKHSKPDDAWVVIENEVYDVTDFAPNHPGGANAVLEWAGHDGTEIYNANHSPTMIADNLDPSKHVGTLDISTITPEWARTLPETTKEPVHNDAKPPLSTIINSYDFEEVAAKTITPKAWAFYSSAATDCITRDRNSSIYNRVFFRPRILKNVKATSTKCRILGVESTLPFFVSPSAMAKLVHPEGEKELARGAAADGIIQCISSNASYPFPDIISAAPTHPFYFQLYVNGDRSKSEQLLALIAASPQIRAIFLTVDNPIPGKREADERLKADTSLSAPNSGAQAGNDSKGGGLGRMMGAYIDSTLNWKDIAWLRRHTKLPIVLKGVQTAQDAMLAARYGCEGIVLSNHGGRNLDTSPASLLVLLELHKICPTIFGKLEILIDGGIRRGTDILKALCLGATAVGLGRPYLYALNYGLEGVTHLTGILADELRVSMQLVGITRLEDAHPGLVNTAEIDYLVPAREGHPYARPVSRGGLWARL